MMTLFGVFTLTFLLVAAVAAVRARNLFVSVMWLGIYSLLMASNFFILDAADVAITEAAVGAGVSTVLFLSALALLTEFERGRARALLWWTPVAVLGAAALLLAYATSQQPTLGDPEAPVHNHVAPWYLAETADLIGIPNVVAAVLASFRGYDTLGEVFVVFIAGIGVMSVLGFKPKRRGVSGDAVAEKVRGLQHHLVLRVVGKLVIPFLLLFALVVQFHGEYSPGGGFPAGALFCAAVMLYAMLAGADHSARLMPQRAMLVIAAFGASLFPLVGLVCMLLGGNFLDYDVLAADPVAGQHLGILLVELGVGMAVAAVLISIFNAIANRETW